MRNHLIISIPAARLDEANTFCKTVDVEGGEKTFETALSTAKSTTIESGGKIRP